MLKSFICLLIGYVSLVNVSSKPAPPPPSGIHIPSGYIVTSNPVGPRVTTPPSGIQILDGICMAKRTDRLVYRHKNDTHVYVAFDVLKKGRVLVYSWEIIKAADYTVISSMKEETLPAVDFRKTVNRDHILGATGKRHFTKFKNRLKRKMEECKKKQHAKRKKKYCKIRSIMNVLVRLKMRNVYFNDTGECDIT